MNVTDLLALWNGVTPDVGPALRTIFYLVAALALVRAAKRVVL